MKLSNGTGYGALACTVSVSPTMSFYTQVPCSLGEDAVGYAVCRFLVQARRFASSFVKESHDLRFAKGKGNRSRRHAFTCPSALLELPGAWAYVKISITATGVSVDHVGLYASLADALEDNAGRYGRSRSYESDEGRETA